MATTDKSEKSTSSTDSTKKTHGQTLQSPIARAVIEGVLKGLTNEDPRERSDASRFFLSGDHIGHCAHAGIDHEWLRRKSTELLNLEGVQRKRAAKDLIEDIRRT